MHSVRTIFAVENFVSTPLKFITERFPALSALQFCCSMQIYQNLRLSML